MISTPSGYRRTLLSAGAVLALGATLSAAALSSSLDTVALFDGSRNTLDIRSAGSFDPAWDITQLAAAGGKEFAVAIGDRGTLLPGAEVHLRIGALNASPRNPARIQLQILDRDDNLGVVDLSGNHVELFGQLIFTVRENDRVLVDHVRGEDLAALTHTWEAPLRAGEGRVLDVTITLDPDLPESYFAAGTGVSFRFSGENTPR